jgi:hypothetical protein
MHCLRCYPFEQGMIHEEWCGQVLGTLGFPPASREPVRPSLAEGDEDAAAVQEACKLVPPYPQRFAVDRPQDHDEGVCRQVDFEETVYIENIKICEWAVRSSEGVVIGNPRRYDRFTHGPPPLLA